LSQFWINLKKIETVWGPDRTDDIPTAAVAALPTPTALLPPFPAHHSRRHTAIIHRLMRL
jgi:hypothetical protein